MDSYQYQMFYQSKEKCKSQFPTSFLKETITSDRPSSPRKDGWWTIRGECFPQGYWRGTNSYYSLLILKFLLQKNLGLKNFRSKNSFRNFRSQKNLYPKNIYVRTNLKSKKNLGPKQFWIQKFLVQKNVGSKEFWVQKFLGLTNFWVQKILG